MALRTRRAAAAAALGVLAGGVPAGTASAVPVHGANPVPESSPSVQGVPANGIALLPVPTQHSEGTGTGDDGGSTPQNDPAVAAAQCAQAAIPSTLPMVITCGPVTINVTFNTVTTTTTITTVSAPITAANGAITTPLPSPVTTTVTNPVPATAPVCKPSRRKKGKTNRPKVAHKPMKAGHKLNVIVRFGPRPRS
ncbi:MAG: hypothetical protein QOH62_3618 [Solirubrobacteraceae bacterium]|jgi:hypothetical protein|nr:hypothetical protein [Solirubrobacteraceae bacterium]